MWSESGNIKGKNIRRIGEPRYIHRKRTGDRENDKTNSTLENTNSILGKKMSSDNKHPNNALVRRVGAKPITCQNCHKIGHR